MNSDLNESLNGILEQIKLLESKIPSNFDISSVDEVNANKQKINEIYEALSRTTTSVRKTKDKVDVRIKERICAVQDSISKLGGGWTEVVRKPKKRELTGGIKPKIVGDLSEVPFVDLYWVKSTEQFAIGVKTEDKKVMLTGDIGEIIIKGGSPEKVKACRHGTNCRDINSCKFWHDPNINKRSRDVRNFMGNSWVYAGKSPELKTLPVCHSGDRRFIDVEAPLITEEEADRRSCMLMHDLLNIMCFPGGVLDSITSVKL